MNAIKEHNIAAITVKYSHEEWWVQFKTKEGAIVGYNGPYSAPGIAWKMARMSQKAYGLAIDPGLGIVGA